MHNSPSANSKVRPATDTIDSLQQKSKEANVMSTVTPSRTSKWDQSNKKRKQSNQALMDTFIDPGSRVTVAQEDANDKGQKTVIKVRFEHLGNNTRGKRRAQRGK